MTDNELVNVSGIKPSGATIKVRVPGTSANCGPGFDCIGLACSVYNDLELMLLREPKLIVETVGEGADSIPTDEKNIVWRSIKTLLDRTKFGSEFKGAVIKMENHIPMSRGLGSSAAAIVAGLKAANAIVGSPFNRQELLQLATDIEGHPDNVAPALLGGFTVSVVNYGKVQTLSFLPKITMNFVLAVPDFPLPTWQARQVLPKEVSLKDAIFNISRASMMVAALIKGKERFFKNVFDDALHQPYRKGLIPGLREAIEAARKAGAIGAALSGAGPSVIAFTIEKQHIANDVASAMTQAFASKSVNARSMILKLDTRGAHII